MLQQWLLVRTDWSVKAYSRFAGTFSRMALPGAVPSARAIVIIIVFVWSFSLSFLSDRPTEKALRLQGWRTCPTRCSYEGATRTPPKLSKPASPAFRGQKCKPTSSGEKVHLVLRARARVSGGGVARGCVLFVVGGGDVVFYVYFRSLDPRTTAQEDRCAMYHRGQREGSCSSSSWSRFGSTERA